MKLNFLSKIKEFYALRKILNSNKYKKITDLFNNLNIDEKNYKKLKKISFSSSIIKKINNLQAFTKIKNHIIKLKKELIENKLNLKIKPNKSQKHFLFLKTSINFVKLRKIFDQVKNYKLLDKKSNDNAIKQRDKYNQKIGIIFYCDHKLVFVSLIINIKNQINILGLTEIPIPGNVIGDFIVEDTNELANVALDSVNLLGLNDSPLLVILSSSFFKIHTFPASDLKQISLTDNKVKSKSPYLADNTIVDFQRMSDSKISSSPIRTIYSKKDLIKSWTDTLQIIDLPIIGLVPAGPHVFDAITTKIVEKITVLIDIEATSTTLLVGGKLDHLTSHKLPFGYSLYISADLKKSSKSFFDRIISSVNLVLDETNDKKPQNIFVMGTGLDKLINEHVSLPKGFKKISELNLTNYSYNPKKMKINEIISDTLENNIHSISLILSSCV